MSDELNKNETAENDTVRPASYSWDKPQNDETMVIDPVIFRRKIKSGYNWAGGTMILQMLILMVVSVVMSVVYSPIFLGQYFEGKDIASLSQAEIMEGSMAMAQDGRYLITANAVSYLIANIASFFIGISIIKAFKAKDIFRKPSMSCGQIVLACLTVLGLQGLSALIQVFISSVTGVTGVSEESMSMMAFGEDVVKNAVILIYFVIIAAVTEELLMRGFVMNALSPISRGFGVVASALLFGLMHGNFNQMFNGFLLGLVFGYAAMKSGSVITTIIMHMVCNANAMFCSYFYEYKLAEAKGEDFAGMCEMIHFGVLLVIGIVAAVILLKKMGRIENTDCVATEYTYEVEESTEAALKWKTLLKCPTFWVVVVFYVGMAVMSLTSISA